jgi:phospholipid transport system substrate-binding protein
MVYTKQGRQIPVAYQTRPAPGDQWKIYDLDVDGISLVGNYRSQFTALIARSSYGDLIEKLRALVGKRPGASRADGVVLVGAGRG